MEAVGRNSRLNALFVTNQKSRQPLEPTTSSACHYRSNKGLKASRELMHESTKTPTPPPPPRDKVGIWKKPWSNLDNTPPLCRKSVRLHRLCGRGGVPRQPDGGRECHLFLAGNRAVLLGNQRFSRTSSLCFLHGGEFALF